MLFSATPYFAIQNMIMESGKIATGSKFNDGKSTANCQILNQKHLNAFVKY